MRFSTLILMMTLSWSPFQTLFANGIGIVDGSQAIYLTLLESDVQVEVSNQIATITTTQTFINNTGSETGFKYGFPLNPSANPISLRWFINGEWEAADIGGSTQNNDIPGTGGGGGGGSNPIDDNLKEYLGDNPLFFSPNDILPLEEIITIEMTYVELLPYFLGKVSFHYANDISVLQNSPLNQQTFSFQLNSEREITAVDLIGLSTEDIINTFDATISYEVFNSVADFNYDLEYELSSDGLGVVPLSLYTDTSAVNCDDFGKGFLSLIIEPESNVNTEVIEKNFTLVIDRSGSMSGEKILQAKAAASFIVNNLNLGDKFNIIDFATNVTPLFNQHVDVNLTNQETALNYIEAINAGSSTNISGALTTAIDQFQVVDPEKANIILFFTDGQPTAGITSRSGILNAVANAVTIAETSIFLFSFGIGEGADMALLTLLAKKNNGLAKKIEDADLEEELTTFFLSINNPVLLNTQITFEPDIIHEIYPFPYPNLYKGQQLIVSGRYAEAQTVNMHIEGQAFNVPVEYDFEFDLLDSFNVSTSILPKIWAKQKIDDLTLDFYLAENMSDEDSIQNVIDTTSICYGVISTDFTSFEDNTTVEVEELIVEDSKYLVRASPNPFQDFLIIEIETAFNSFEDVKIEIFSIDGQLLYEKEDSLLGQYSKFQLQDLQTLPNGIYLCKLKIGDAILTLRIVKT